MVLPQGRDRGNSFGFRNALSGDLVKGESIGTMDSCLRQELLLPRALSILKDPGSKGVRHDFASCAMLSLLWSGKHAASLMLPLHNFILTVM